MGSLERNYKCAGLCIASPTYFFFTVNNNKKILKIKFKKNKKNF
jgi:hypothetical protein